MFAVVIFVSITLSLLASITSPVIKYIITERGMSSSKKSYFVAEAALEDVIRRLQMYPTILPNEIQNVDGGTVTVTTTDTSSGKEVIAEANIGSYIRKVKTELVLGQSVSFHYGVQAGVGGFNLNNGSSVVGSVYSDGPVTGSSGNIIDGDAISAGVSGLLHGLVVKNSAYAHTIENVGISKDAYYKIINGSSVARNSYPGSEDQALVSLPISDTLIDEWKSDALAGGVATTSCPYVINSSITLGPVKISCDMEVNGNDTVLTLTGPVWVKGNVEVKNATIKVSSALGNKNVPLIADNPDDKLTSGKIKLTNHTDFEGSGSGGSYVFLISGNTSAENGGGDVAISMAQGAGAMVAYASHGLINLANSISVKEATAYKINLGQSATVTYDTGLPSVLFKAGPSGVYNIIEWGESI